MTLPDSAVPLTREAVAVGDLPHTKAVTVQVWLSPRLAAAERFATAVSTPSSPAYRDFLSPDAYTAEFGPTGQEASTVAAWLRSRGFTDVAADAQRDDIRATATVGRIDAAFHTAVERYRSSVQTARTGASWYANDGSLSVPSRVARDVLGITGLDDADAPRELGSPAAVPVGGPRAGGRGSCSHYWGQHTISGLPGKYGTTRFPTVTCGYTGAQFRSAYGENASNAGRGQTIAFTMAGGLVPHLFATLKDFARENHLPTPRADRFEQINQQPSSCHKSDDSPGPEDQMDIEAAYAMAPGARQIVVGANTCDTADGGFQGGFNTDLAIIDGNGRAPLATVVSNSWETGYDDQAADINQIETAFLVKAAAEGVGMYYSAGDSPCVAQPASNPYATGVGGTTLAISRSGTRLFETGNAIGNDAIGHHAWSKTVTYFGLAGGQSLLYPQPGYQRGVVPRSMSIPPQKGSPPGQAGCRDGGPLPPKGSLPMRSAPDVSASASNMSVGVITHGRYTHMLDGETSLSAPLVAGMVVAAQQGQARPFGFLNPALYRLAGTPALYDPRPITRHDPRLWRAAVCTRTDYFCRRPTLWLTDDQSRDERGDTGQVTAKGYDNTTGVGVPNGQAFIKALRDLP